MTRYPITGFTTSIREYARVEGIILRPAEAIVKYGTLVLVDDKTQGKQYLGMILNVEEETPHPALDVDRLRRLYQTISETSLEDANRVLLELLSPTHKLIKWSSIMRVELRILGEIAGPPGARRLQSYERPPRPFSTITEPDPQELERIIHYSLSREGRDYKQAGLYLGRLSLLEKVRIFMNPDRLNTHLSILAQTGAGKTETVKRLVYEISRRRKTIGKPEGGIVIFDIAGEYTGYPYLREDTVPLLDAVLEPWNYGDLEGGEVSVPSKVTIIVPYEATRLGWREQEAALLEGLRDLARTLCRRLKRRVSLLVFLSFERHYLEALPEDCQPSGERRLRYDEAYNVIGDSEFLIVGLPLPGFMDVDTMVEVSGTHSEYFPLLVADIAGALDLYHGTDVYGVSLLLSIVEQFRQKSLVMLDDYEVEIDGRKVKLPRILAEFAKRCEEGKFGFEYGQGLTGMRLTRRLYFAFMRYLAWTAYKWGVADPSQDSETRAICKLVKSERLSDLASMLRDLRAIRQQDLGATTLASAQRALRKLESVTSDLVDTILFDKLMERLMTGFSIVHLAPPSTGNVDQLLSLLIKRLFMLHVGNYSPRRLTVLVVEEAHNLAPAGEEKASKRSLLRVAREGRKWGFSLWLVTQRPSFVDASLLSQTATSILLRTTNPDDLSTIRRGVESAAAEIVDRLPELEPSRGEALLVGLAAPERRIPLLVMVEKLERIKPS